MALLFMVSGRIDAKAKNSDEENSRPPIGCRDMGYQFDLKTLRLSTSDGLEARQGLFVIYNHSNKNIGLFQMLGEESSRSMYLNHQISAGQWAVLSTSAKKMKYICTIAEGKNAYGKIVDCADHLMVCQYNNVRFGLNNQGNYWLVNSSTKNGAINAIVHYGIIPGA